MPSKTPNVRLDYARSNQGEIFSQLSDAVLEGNDAIQPESQMKWIKYVTEPLYCEWIKHVTESLDEMMQIKHATEPLGEIKWIKHVTGPLDTVDVCYCPEPLTIFFGLWLCRKILQLR